MLLGILITDRCEYCGVVAADISGIVAPESDVIDHVDPELTLHGLRIVWERNQ